jgi:hypothetical protein
VRKVTPGAQAYAVEVRLTISFPSLDRAELLSVASVAPTAHLFYLCRLPFESARESSAGVGFPSCSTWPCLQHWRLHRNSVSPAMVTLHSRKCKRPCKQQDVSTL